MGRVGLDNLPLAFAYTSIYFMYVDAYIFTQKLLATSLWVLKSDLKLKTQIHYDQNHNIFEDFVIFTYRLRENNAHFERDKLVRMLKPIRSSFGVQRKICTQMRIDFVVMHVMKWDSIDGL